MSRHSFSHGFLAGALFGLAPLLALISIGTVGAQSSPAGADVPRIALVIGNSTYETLTALPTSANDAQEVEKALVALGFEVTREVDAPLQTMRDAMGRFLVRLGAPENSNALAVLYFAGYGLKYDGYNYMLPVDFDIDEGQDDLAERALWLEDQIARPMTGARDAGANVILLEACREDPFGDAPGLAQIADGDLPERALIMFSAQPGQASADKVDLKAPEPNGIFTKELVDQLNKPGSYALDGFFDVVAVKVSDVSKGAQKPRVMASRDLGAVPVMIAKASTAAGAPEDLNLWREVETSPDQCDFDHYLAAYPSGEFADLARAKIKAIEEKNEALEKAMRSVPESVATLMKAAQTQSAARCAAKYGGTSASLLPATASPWAPRKLLAGGPVSTGAVGTRGRGSSGRSARSSPRFANIAHTRRGEFRLAQATGAAASPAPVGDEEFQATLLKAEQGNVDAMYRVALIYESGSNSVPANVDEMLRWLVVSSALGNGIASYELYRYYNADRATLAEAVRYRSLAKKQGYAGPPGLSTQR